jgi:ectoine hydroxylase-related dioxygenase (phytanoyl-CoA dioxygenase family)
MFRATSDPQRDDLSDLFSANGIAVVEYYLSRADLAHMDTIFPSLGLKGAGARANAFSSDAQSWFATHAGLLDLASRLLKGEARLSRLQAFDKSPTANWFVPWHQDRAEDGREREIAHLERTVALRIHLDDCEENNGPLEVVPRSHLLGRLDAAAIAKLVAEAPSQLCLAVRGDIVALRPLLLHRSQRAQRPSARRVVHIEFSAVAPRGMMMLS